VLESTGTEIQDAVFIKWRNTTIHPWYDVTPGEDVPKEFNALIEILYGSSVKYELEEKSGLIKLDRVLYSAVFYPANYGFIPRLLQMMMTPWMYWCFVRKQWYS